MTHRLGIATNTGSQLAAAGRQVVGPVTERRFRFDHFQRVLDAVALLQVQRTKVAVQLARGEVVAARIVGAGCTEITANLRTESFRWKTLCSVRHVVNLSELRESLPQNRRIVSRGLRMTSVFDYRGTQPSARMMLSGETLGDYRLAAAPLSMKIVDQQELLLSGPIIDGLETVMAVADPVCLAAATAYWNAVLLTAFPARELRSFDVELTDRQRQVVALLSEDLNDDQIALALSVSVRTVRADIAQLMAATGVRSRFSLGRVLNAK